MTYHLALFVIIIILALACAMTKNILFSTILLSLVSVVAALILFTFASPWAAVFELSVCAGLITALFIGVISLISKEKKILREPRLRFTPLETGRQRRTTDIFNVLPLTGFTLLPIALLIMAVISWLYLVPFFESLSKYPHLNIHNYPLGQIIWKDRVFDLIGQICIFAAGVFAIKSIFARSTNEQKSHKSQVTGHKF